MKMGDRKSKRLDKLGTQVQRKTHLTGEPTNRAERRKFKHVLKQARVEPEDIDRDALFAALKAHNA